MLEQETGIILIAIGHAYYGRMAYNLAMSIKAVERYANITLVYSASSISHINQRNMHVFDNKFEVDEINQPFAAKLLLDSYSPYKRTIYIDVDTLWVNKQGPASLFEKLKGIPFTGITEGMYDYEDITKSDLSKIYPMWADLTEIKDLYNLHGKIYQWRSEFMYFEKCDSTALLFTHMRDAYARASELKTLHLFAEHIPDELAINVATNQCGVAPHLYKWKATYWDRMHGSNMADIADLQTNYYAISCGSNHGTPALKQVYNRVCSASASRLGLQHVFPLVNKKEMMTNRQKM